MLCLEKKYSVWQDKVISGDEFVQCYLVYGAPSHLSLFWALVEMSKCLVITHHYISMYFCLLKSNKMPLGLNYQLLTIQLISALRNKSTIAAVYDQIPTH